MNKRALILAGLTLLGWVGCAKSDPTPYTVKITSVSRFNSAVEAKFVVMPEDLRIVCHGDAKIFEGDYVKLAWKDGFFYIAGTEIKCTEMRWLR